MLKKIFYLLLMSPSFVFCQDEHEFIKSIYTVSQLREDCDILHSNLITYHPDLYLYSSKVKIDSFFTSLDSKLYEGMSGLELYNILTPLLSRIKNNHTQIEPPDSYGKYLLTIAKRLPFQFYFDSGKLFVFEDSSNEKILGKGARILSINGEEVGDVLSLFRKRLSRDGYNMSLTDYVMATSFSRLYAYLYGVIDYYDIVYEDLNGQIKNQKIRAINVPQIIKNNNNEERNTNLGKIDFTFDVRKGIGVLKVDFVTNTFDGGKELVFSDVFRFNVSVKYQLPLDYGGAQLCY